MPNAVINGIMYHYDASIPNTDPEEIVIFVHGAGGSHRHWMYQINGLGDSILAIALDLPGHGKSGGNVCNTIADYCEFIYNFAEHIIGAKFIMVGHSMGGAITMEFAMRYPHMLEKLILIGTGARLRVAPSMLDAFAQGKKFPQMINFAYGQGASIELLKAARQEMEMTDALIYYNDFVACNNFDVMNEVKSINLPTLIIAAAEDKLTPPKYSEYLANNINGSQMTIIKKAGHMMMLEYPEEVNIIIKHFIR